MFAANVSARAVAPFSRSRHEAPVSRRGPVADFSPLYWVFAGTTKCRYLALKYR